MIDNHIRVHRARLKMTQEDLANQVGATRQTILAIEKNKYAPSLKLAFDIAEVFDVGIEEVFFISKGDKDEKNN